MKNTIRYISLILVVCSLFATFVGCSLGLPEDKDFSKAGLTITLTDDFSEQDLITQTAYYVSNKAIVTTLREDSRTIKVYNVKNYANLVCESNKLNSTVTTKDDYAEFTYEKGVNGKEFFFYARCYKDGVNFWLVQFACETKNKDDFMPKFNKWGDSIVFED